LSVLAAGRLAVGRNTQDRTVRRPPDGCRREILGAPVRHLASRGVLSFGTWRYRRRAVHADALERRLGLARTGRWGRGGRWLRRGLVAGCQPARQQQRQRQRNRTES